MYIVNFTAPQQGKMVRTPHFFGLAVGSWNSAVGPAKCPAVYFGVVRETLTGPCKFWSDGSDDLGGCYRHGVARIGLSELGSLLMDFVDQQDSGELRVVHSGSG